MAIVQPAFVVAWSDQDLNVVVTISGDATSWAMTATLRTSAKSATALVTKTVGSGITVSGGGATITINFADTDITLTPGAYVWSLVRTDAGVEFPIVDESAFLLAPADGSAYPQLTNLSEFLGWQGVSETVADADAKMYLQLLAAAEAAIRSLCGRHFNQSSYTEYLNANWTRLVQLNETPVSTTDIDIRFDHNRAFGAETELTYGTDCIFELAHDGLSHSGLLQRQNTVWAGGHERPLSCLTAKRVPAIGVIKAVYTGGYALIPHDLKLAIWETVADRMAARGRGAPFQSESGLNYSYSLGNWEQEAQKLLSVQSVIRTYRRGDLLVG